MRGALRIASPLIIGAGILSVALLGCAQEKPLLKPAAYLEELPRMSAAEYEKRLTQSGREHKPAQAGAEHIVRMTRGQRFAPERLVIAAGDTVIWRNGSSLIHTVTADPSLAADKPHAVLPPGAETFNSGEVQPDDTYRRTFTVPGRYKYFCIPHETAGMTGEIEVKKPGDRSVD